MVSRGAPSAPSVHSSQHRLRGLDARPSTLQRRSSGPGLTCVHVPHGHHDPDPAAQEEADLLCIQHLLDGREPLKAQSGGGGGVFRSQQGERGSWAGCCPPDPPWSGG